MKKRLQLKNTEFLHYFGLSAAVMAEELAQLGGPSRKTTKRVLNRELTTIRSHTLVRLTRAADTFYGKVLPRLSGFASGGSETDQGGNLSHEKEEALDRFKGYLSAAAEPLICAQIADRCGNQAKGAILGNEAGRRLIYNLCVLNGAEYLIFHPHPMEFCVDFQPEERGSKVALPMRRWAEQQVKLLNLAASKTRVRTLQDFACLLDLNKQELQRYMDTVEISRLPRFSTMKKWAELVGEAAGPDISRLFVPSLSVARFLHHYYLDNLARGELAPSEVLSYFRTSAQLRALWPSLLHDS